MKINVADLKGSPGTQFDVVLEGHPFSIGKEIAPEVTLLAPITAALRVSNSSGLIIVNGTIRTRILLNCSRCLEEFAMEIDAPCNEIFREVGVSTTTAKEENELTLFSGDTIDLAVIIRDNLIAALPMKAVCREKCRGLCPSCGKNLNQAQCTCQKHGTDPRLAVLSKLLVKEQK